MGRLLVLLLAAAGCRPAAPSRAPSLVTVSLLPSTTHVVPGRTVELGVRFSIAPEWHIYWMNPGETGLATRVELISPSWSNGEVAYPGPRSIRASNSVSYGYEREAALFLRAAAPATIAGPQVRFQVRARWLACREECIPGEAVASIELPVGSEEKPVADDPLTPHRARLPVDPPVDLASEWHDEASARILVLIVPGASAVELFPFADQPTLFRGQDASHDRTKVRFAKPEAAAATSAVTGVLRVERDGVARYHSISIPWP